MATLTYTRIEDVEQTIVQERENIRSYLLQIELGHEEPDAFALQLLTDSLKEAENLLELLHLSEEFLVDCD